VGVIKGDMSVMKKMLLVFSSLLLVYEIVCQEVVPVAPKSVEMWYEKAKDRNPDPAAPRQEPIVSFEGFRELLEKHIDKQKGFLMGSPWLGTKMNVSKTALRNDLKNELDDPFALKISINSGGMAYFWGDLHGDVAALAIALKKLKDDRVIDDAFAIIAPDTYFFFLGDMVDRGAYQTDLLSLIFILAAQNMGKVFLIRGNHEDLIMNNSFGFINQLKRLYGYYDPSKILPKNNPIFFTISLLYNLMPDVAFVGCNNNYLQCCHGGLEILYNPKELLAQSEKLEYQLIKKPITFDDNPFLKNTIDFDASKHLGIHTSALGHFSGKSFKLAEPFTKSELGFLWGDFNNDSSNNYATYHEPNRGLFSGKIFTQKVLNYYSSDTIRVRGIMRAHQHNPTLPGIFTQANTGVYPMWEGSVITNLSTSIFRGVNAFNRITFFDDYDLWHLTNYSGKGDAITTIKDNLLKDWKNNYEPPVEEKIAEKVIEKPQPTINIQEKNAGLFAKISDEVEKQDPTYQDIEKWLKQIEKGSQVINRVQYARAQELLKILDSLLKGLEYFKKSDYTLAESEFAFLLEEDLFKYKARELYAKSVIAGEMEDFYAGVINILQGTRTDESASLYDQTTAESLEKQLRNLMQPKEEI
jgi:hypothetical protein